MDNDRIRLESRARETMLGESLTLCPLYLTFKDHKDWTWESGKVPPTRPIMWETRQCLTGPVVHLNQPYFKVLLEIYFFTICQIAFSTLVMILNCICGCVNVGLEIMFPQYFLVRRTPSPEVDAILLLVVFKASLRFLLSVS